MTTVSRRSSQQRSGFAELHSGDCMTRKEFHQIYEEMPDEFRAELIEGIVYVASPLKIKHGKYHLTLGAVFAAYEGNTSGITAGDNASVFLSDEDEVQPDLHLRIERGGQSKETSDDYLDGPPELVAEIANSSRAIDMHKKRVLYERFGVLEYIVLCVRPLELYWFDLKNGNDLVADKDGVIRSHVFPGLWLHVDSLLKKDYKRMMKVLNLGLQSAEYIEFAAKLAKHGK